MVRKFQMLIKISKINNVSIGAHPSFKDPENFGRKRINLNPKEIKKLLDRRDYDTLMFLIVGKKNMSSLTKSYPYLEEIISEISSMSNNEINKENTPRYKWVKLIIY